MPRGVVLVTVPSLVSNAEQEVSLPKKKKQPRKPSTRPGSQRSSPAHTHDIPPGWTPEALSGLTQMGMSRGLSSVPDEAWDRLRAGLLEQHPVCPDCGAEWDLDTANEEEGETFGGQHVISISAMCSAYDADEEAGREPAPHPLTDGMAEFELTLA